MPKKKFTELSFHEQTIYLIKKVPKGKVATYGQIAAMTGHPRAARQVVRILHSSSKKENLPWHRIINSKGQISLKPGNGFEEQYSKLLSEGIKFRLDKSIDLDKYLWLPKKP